MTISNLPSELNDLLVQPGFLLRFIEDAIQPILRYRSAFESMQTKNGLGEKFTITRKGLLPKRMTPISPAANSELTSGLAKDKASAEQYSVELSQYGSSDDVQLLNSNIAIEDLFTNAVMDLGNQAARSIEGVARKTLFHAYNGGRSYFQISNAGPALTARVNNGYGFEAHYVDGVRVATSVTNPLPVTITQTGTESTAFSITNVDFTGFTEDDNDDTKQATVTFGANVDVDPGDVIISSKAPFSIRSGGKTTSNDLVSSDVLKVQSLIDMSNALRGRGVRPCDDGYFHGILNADQVSQLHQDEQFQRTYDGNQNNDEYLHGYVGMAGGVKIYTATETPTSTNLNGVKVHRAVVFGREMGYEARASIIAKWLDGVEMTATGAVVFSPEAHVAMVFRQPLDALQQVVTVSWSFIGDFVCATDSLSTLGGNVSQYVRAGVIESGA